MSLVVSVIRKILQHPGKSQKVIKTEEMLQCMHTNLFQRLIFTDGSRIMKEKRLSAKLRRAKRGYSGAYRTADAQRSLFSWCHHISRRRIAVIPTLILQSLLQHSPVQKRPQREQEIGINSPDALFVDSANQQIPFNSITQVCKCTLLQQWDFYAVFAQLRTS